MQQNIPLAERVRPKQLTDYIGQSHLLGENAPIKQAIENGILPSLILWGPPGVGKTTLANLIADELKRPFYTLSAISSGVKDVREVIQKVSGGGMFSTNNAILFIDEIHRFSKAQQDSLLGAVEKGVVTLIGATTENPSFEVIPALLSRCQVYVLEEFSKKDLTNLLKRAMLKDVFLKEKQINLKELEALLMYSGGDGRKLLNNFELVVNNLPDNSNDVTNELVAQILPKKRVRYDKDGEQHYDIISAFIKSIRGSDPDAAVYWLARMIEGGEDPKFIARRLIISASEDIGLANPNALMLANQTFEAINVIGWPEARIILSQCTIYLATSAKSNTAYMAINKAQELVKQTGDLSVPLHLRNAPTKLMKDLNYGGAYKYPFDYSDNYVNQQYLPDEIKHKELYIPGEGKKEFKIKK